MAKLWMLGLAVLVLTALAVSAIRGSLPYLNQYQPQISAYLEQHHQIHLDIGQVSGHWKGGGPKLVLEDVGFNNKEQLGFNLQVKQLTLHFDLVASIRAFSPRFSVIELDKPHLLLGTFPPTNEPEEGEEVFDPFPLLIDLVQELAISEATIAFDSSYGVLPPIEFAKLTWLSVDEQRQLQLSMTSASGHNEVVNAIVDLRGKTQEQLYGRVYIKANQWQWLDDLKVLLPQLDHQAQAQASFELWADFSASQLDSMILRLGDNELAWSSNELPQRLSLGQDQVQWLSYRDGWILEAEALELTLNGQALNPVDLYLNQQRGLVSGQLSQIDISLFDNLVGLLSASELAQQQLAMELSPQGKITEFKFQQQNSQWYYQGQIANYSQQLAKGIPQVNGLYGQFSGVGLEGKADLSINDSALNFGDVFSQPMSVKDFNTTLFWGGDTERFWFGSDRLTFNNNHLTLESAWQVTLAPQSGPVLSLYGEASVHNLTSVQYYLPQQLLGEGLTSYLEEGIQRGKAKEVSLLWQGELGHFPYQHHRGTFEVLAKVEQAQFQFAPDWSPVSRAKLDLHFKNEAMLITGHSGRVNNLAFDKVTVAIDDLLNAASVNVGVNVNQGQSRIKKFVAQSPIDEVLSPVLSHLDVSGRIHTRVDIDVPFDGGDPSVTGHVKLRNNNLNIKAMDLDVHRLRGTVEFNGGEVVANTITGQLFEQPVKLDIKTKPLGNDYGIAIDLAAKWHSEKVPEQWRQYLDKYIAGELDWLGRVTLKVTEGDVHYQANFKSPMTGLELKLPKPLDKYVSQQEDLLVSTTGTLSGGQFNMALGSRAEVLAQFEIGENGFVLPDVSLLVGRGFQVKDTLREQGLSIKVDLDTLALDEWLTFISNIEQGQSDGGIIPPLHHISAQVKELQVFGQTLESVTLSGVKELEHWAIDVVSEQAQGQIKLYDDFKQRGIEVDFERLALADSQDKESKQATVASLQALPPLLFKCKQCSFTDSNLGQVSFRTQPHPQGVEVKDFLVNAQRTTLKADAIWGFDEQGEFTRVTGSLASDNLEATLGIFNYSSSIKDSDAVADIDVTWRGNLYSPDIASLNGDFKWRFGEGHIAEVSDKGARIFSLFSLDSLRRKLLLDFRDVFVEGIFFNYFEGSFQIEDGVAVTRNAYMDAIAGDVDVIGSINLVTTDLDYYITFSPRLISNIPVIAGVVTSTPQVFILAFALTKVLEPIVDVVSQVNFKLSGTVATPEFIEVNRQQKKYRVPEHILPKPAAAEEAEPPQGAHNQLAPSLKEKLDVKLTGELVGNTRQ
ncbi:TIGR02099 family protein [Alteromonadales bacterium alter-6D02]|nr:TIGR02099 family protein [Alteromonadales bacterium alter-6D02]